MSLKTVAAIAVGLCAVLLLCSGLVGAVMGAGGIGGDLPDCSATFVSTSPEQPTTVPANTPVLAGPTAQSASPQVPGYTDEQMRNAATIVTVGQQQAVPPRGWVIAVATALQESSLRNLAGGDRDSVGLFQQRPSQGWGTPTQLLDPAYAATKFYQALARVPDWQQLPLTEAAQAVQRSALPEAYARWESDATTIVAAITGLPAASLIGCGTISAQGWTQPLRAPVSSGFRTAERPGHQGVDLMVAKGTPIRAAAAGAVLTVRCNIHPASWGCDRDGDPVLTAGCGWYVDIEHAGRVFTRYCHQLRRPEVTEGQQVTAGQVIGVSGNSGHSSGPHLHFEVHLGDTSPLSAIDPIAWMRDHGAPLG